MALTSNPGPHRSASGAAAKGRLRRGRGANDELRAAFLRRSEAAIDRIARLADKATLLEAMSARTDYGALAVVMSGLGSADTAIRDLDPEAADLGAEIAHRDELERRAGGNLSAEQVGRLLGISRQAVDKRRRCGTLLATRQGGNWAYPRAQFLDKETIPGLAAVVTGLKESGPWVTLEFLVTVDDALAGMTPRDALVNGGAAAEQALMLVRGYRRGEGFA
jgi:hypothetical protein